jgi:hypothetical protein
MGRTGGLAARAAVVWLLGGASALAAPASAQPPIPAGGEFQVNTYTTNYQYHPAAAMAADGSFVVVWESYGSFGTDTSSFSIQGQRYASGGSAQGGEFQVNIQTLDGQYRPAVALGPGGGFVVVWESASSTGPDTSGSSIQARRYASDGSPVGWQFQVNTFSPNDQVRAAVASAADGSFVVAWQSVGSPGTDSSGASIQARRYASSGSTAGAQFQVNEWTTGNQERASVAVADGGGFTVAWVSPGSTGTDTSSTSVQARRFASDGTALGGEFQVNAFTTDAQTRPHAAASAVGDFVVVWDSYGSPSTDTSGWSVQGQRFASDGSAQGAQFQVNTYTTSHQFLPGVEAAGDGSFVVAWDSLGSPGTDTSTWSAQGQRFASDGSALGDQFQINTYTTNLQGVTAVSVASPDEFLVVWASQGSFGTDTDLFSVQSQRYAEPTPQHVPSLSPGAAAAAALLMLAAAARGFRRRAGAQ